MWLKFALVLIKTCLLDNNIMMLWGENTYLSHMRGVQEQNMGTYIQWAFLHLNIILSLGTNKNIYERLDITGSKPSKVLIIFLIFIWWHCSIHIFILNDPGMVSQCAKKNSWLKKLHKSFKRLDHAHIFVKCLLAPWLLTAHICKAHTAPSCEIKYFYLHLLNP